MEGFTTIALITGILCYGLGMLVGLYLNRSSREENIREAYEQGRRQGRAEMDSEKQSLGRAVTEKLARMRDTLVDTYAAYEQAVELVEEKLHPGALKRLKIEYKKERLEDRQTATIRDEKNSANPLKKDETLEKAESTRDIPATEKAPLAAQVKTQASRKKEAVYQPASTYTPETNKSTSRLEH
ncbi:MAG: hypothetical protein KDD64_07965 [Bdellovibrionales bacterium]|nr:hypothetical protein [Bdellovibrionales bacterium]